MGRARLANDRASRAKAGQCSLGAGPTVHGLCPCRAGRALLHTSRRSTALAATRSFLDPGRLEKAVCSYYCRNWQRADNGKYHASADESSVKAEAVAQLVCQDAVELLGEHPHLQDCHEEEQHGESVATRLCKVVVRSIFVGRRDGNEQRKRGRNDERGDYLQD